MRNNKFKGINIGDLVWEECQRGGDVTDYHPAVVKKVNVNESYVDVIDVSSIDHPEKKYYRFLTASEMIERGTKPEDLEREKIKYKPTIEKVMKEKQKEFSP